MCSAIRNFNSLICHTRKFKSYIALSHRQKSDYLSSSMPTIKIPNATIPEYIFQSFYKYPNAIAVECEFTGKKYTFDDIRLKSRNFDKNLRKKLKLQKGDVIAIVLPNVADYPICVFGAFQAGLIVTTINPYYTSGEISRQLYDANPKAVVTLSSLYRTVQEALQISKLSIPTLTINTKQSDGIPQGAINLNEFTQTKVDVNDVTDLCSKDVALILYSSGTTGLPKAVQHAHENIVTNLTQLNTEEVRYIPDRSETYENRHLALSPWFHMFGLTAVLFNQLHLLTKLICVPKFSPESFINMLVKYKPNGLYVVPPIIIFLASNPYIRPKFLESISTITYGAAPLSKTDLNNYLNKVNKKVNMIQGYGLTETQAVCYTLLKNFAINNDSSMELLANTCVKIVEPENYNKSLGKNESGEILVKGPQVMKGYYNCSNKINDGAFWNGWFKTGDFGYYDEKGFVYITNRLKEIIKVNSFQVAPTELENIIGQYKDVVESAVIGIPDKQHGEIPLAFVVPKPNSRINVNKLQEYVASQVVKYKQLKGGVIIVDSLPKNGTGKVLRNNLLEIYNNGRFEKRIQSK